MPTVIRIKNQLFNVLSHAKISNTYFEKFFQNIKHIFGKILSKYFDKIFQFFGFYCVECSKNIKI